VSKGAKTDANVINIKIAIAILFPIFLVPGVMFQKFHAIIFCHSRENGNPDACFSGFLLPQE
jgi:hypothetical protein